MKTNHIRTAIIVQIAALLPVIEFNAEWAGTTDYFENLLNADLESMENMTVYTCEDHHRRRMFIARCDDSINVVFQRYSDEQAEETFMTFQGDQRVAEVMECSTTGAVSIESVTAFFAFFGPPEAAELLMAETHAQAEAVQAAADATAAAHVEGVTAANEDIASELNGGEQLTNKERLERLIAQPAPAPVAGQVTILRIDTPLRKTVAALTVGGLFGLAAYGAIRLFR